MSGSSPSQLRYNLDHAPPTPHGTYIDGMNDGLEPLENYQADGYHPVHLSDCLGPLGRYRVIHKLGYGGFSTVWLCRDTQDAKCVAIKVMISHVTVNMLVDLNLEAIDRSLPGAEHIAFPLDHFELEGPNGTHHCLVLPVLGPCVSPGLWRGMEGDAATILRNMALQATQALALLHKSGLCHGDFRPANILVKLTNIDTLTENELFSIIGEPIKSYVRTESGDDLPTFSPGYLVIPADLSNLSSEYLTDQISVIDFGESFPISEPPEMLGIPDSYLPPELLLEEEDAVGPASDLWALGCTLFEIRQQIPLFYMINDPDELLAEIVQFFGKFPHVLWEKWEARADCFREDGTLLKRPSDEWSLEVSLSKPRKIFLSVLHGGDPNAPLKTLETSEKEQRHLADLLYKVFRYDPEARLGVDEVLEHEWFKMGGLERPLLP